MNFKDKKEIHRIRNIILKIKEINFNNSKKKRFKKKNVKALNNLIIIRTGILNILRIKNNIKPK